MELYASSVDRMRIKADGVNSSIARSSRGCHFYARVVSIIFRCQEAVEVNIMRRFGGYGPGPRVRMRGGL